MTRRLMLVAIIVMAAVGTWVAASADVGSPAARLQRATPGKHPPAPPFSAPLLGTSRTVDRAALLGRPSVLDFWASWCPPCRDELPVLGQLSRSSAGHFAVVGVDVRDKPADAAAALRRARATYPNLADPDGRIATSFQVVGTPTIVVLDARGAMVGQLLGPASAAAIHTLLNRAHPR